ncbi:response regulator [Trebonia kvetii]|uniref:Response regulator n=1 Tax=Trebonia kvetii TaxID=2480626 RepID=A0A6P2C1E8_9ACTN|nr:response regulator [Trebonia kvetii]TVZ04315.1 response regulator [Trebonia kvetii]
MTRVLVVDDEPQILRALRINLRARQYEVATAATGAQALEYAGAHPPDLVILDLGLPDMDGVEVIGGLRGWTAVPIIVLSGRADSADKVEALDAGADDYVTKPFGMDELLARMRAAVRRTPAAEAPPRVQLGDLTIDLAAKRVIRQAAEDDPPRSNDAVRSRDRASRPNDGGPNDGGPNNGGPRDEARLRDARHGDEGKVALAGVSRTRSEAGEAAGDADPQPDGDIRLTPTEWHLLEVLLRNPGKLLSHRQLLHDVWGPGYDNAGGNLRLYMAQLRRKLEPDPARPRWLITEPGMGYRYQPPSAGGERSS